MRSASEVILDMASDLVTDETFIVLRMFSSFNRREVNGINVHDIGVLCCSGKEGSDTTSSLESNNPFLLSMEFAHLFNLFV